MRVGSSFITPHQLARAFGTGVVLALVAVAGSAGAQVRPAPAPRPPVAPSPVLAPRPASAPRPAPHPSDLLFDQARVWDLHRELDAARFDYEALAAIAGDARFEFESTLWPDAHGIREEATRVAAEARALSASLAPRVPGGAPAAMRGPLAEFGIESAPPAPWAQDDPADSLYRRARELLNAGAHLEAATLFARIATDFPRSQYAPDALYWEAFARYRIGRTDQMRLALASLERQRTQFPRASTGSDANALATRIRGALANGGDAAAQRVLQGQLTAAGSSGYVRASAAPVAPSSAATAVAIAGGTRVSVTTAAAPRAAAANCDAGDLAVRIEALNALSKLESVNITPTLNAVLARRDECSAGLRRQALILLSRQATPEAWAQLRRSATDDPDASVRRQAVNFLGRAPAEVAIPALSELSRTGSDESLQRDAVSALGSVDDARARQMLRELVTRTDGRESIRESAIAALGRDRSGENATWLRSEYARLDSRGLRERALSVISGSGMPDNDRWLLSVSQDANESMELRASALARSLRGTMDIASMARLYDGLREPQLRSRVIAALRTREEPAATDKLLAIARQDSDPALRRAAISALAAKKDPRTERLLLEIINP